MDITLGSKEKGKEEYKVRLSGSPREDPSHCPLAYCRQRSNMETDASLNTLPTCPTIASKHFQLECRMKGNLHSRMEALPQPVDILGIKVIFSLGSRKYFLKENFKVIFFTRSRERPFLCVTEL